MFTRLRSRLFRRRTLPRSIVSPSMLAYLVGETERARIAQDIEDDPDMCLPQLPGKPTAHVTRAIETSIFGQDELRTMTMETEIVHV